MLAAVDWPRLDARAWNMGFVAASTTVLAACGPLVPVGETDSDSVTDTDPAPTEATDTAPGPCNGASDCQPGEDCINGLCQDPYDVYCQDGTASCCLDDGCYYEPGCYSDLDCGPQSICNDYAECMFVEPLPACESELTIDVYELPLGEGEPIVSLAFVEVNGDGMDDLVVGRSGSAQVHLGPDGAFPLTLPVPAGAEVIDATSGDLDGDGDGDIVAATAQGSLLVLTSGGPLGFELATDVPMGQPVAGLATLDFEGDGALDVTGVTADGQALLLFGDGLGGFSANATLNPGGDVARSLAVTDYGGDALGDIVLQDDTSTVQAFFGDAAGSVDWDMLLNGSSHGDRRLTAGPIAAGAPWEVLGATHMSDGWLLLELWNDGMNRPRELAIVGDANRVELGDLDGNGTSDLVVAGVGPIHYALAGSDPTMASIECVSPIYGAEITTFAVGDFDGNGRADVALQNGLGISILRTQ